MEQSTLERQVMRKVAWRLLPFMGMCYMAAFLDRVNVSFAKLSMLTDLNLSIPFGATSFASCSRSEPCRLATGYRSRRLLGSCP
jgi:hypothetical protein